MTNRLISLTARLRVRGSVLLATYLLCQAVAVRADEPPANQPIQPANNLSAEPAAPSAMPRFALAVGQELRYRGFDAFWRSDKKLAREADGTPTKADRLNLALYVVKKNLDGSFRVAMVVSPDGRSAHITSADLFPDGRTTPLDFRPWTSLRDIFPLLPGNTTHQRNGWEERIGDANCKYSCDAREIKRELVYNDYPGGRTTKTYRLRPDNGMPQLVVEEGTFNGVDHNLPKEHRISVYKSEIRIELQSLQQHPPNWSERVNADVRRCEVACKAFEHSQAGNQVPLAAAAHDLAAVRKILDERRACLANAVKEIGDPTIRSVLEGRLQYFDMYRNYDEESARRLAKIANHPAPRWEADDMQGKRHTLQQYRGQVIVMDFWFRNCPGCVKLAPQINAVARHFEKQQAPVTFLNVTFEEADNARAMRDKIKPHGPILLQKDLEETFAVEVYPTVIVLDQQGIVRGFFPGYADERGKEVTRFVESLLAANPDPVPANKTR